MLTDYQLFSLAQSWPVLAVIPFVVALYYLAGSPRHPGRRRLAAAPGVILLAAYGYALAVAPYAGPGQSGGWLGPFWFLLTLFIVAEAYCLARFDGIGWAHGLQLLLIPAGLLVWLLGTMTITHEWV